MKNKIRAAAGAACLLAAPLSVQGQAPNLDEVVNIVRKDPPKEVVVTATRSSDGVRADLLGASFTVLDPIDLERRQTRVVSDILRDVPGISVSRSGGVGGLTQVRMRGAEGNHTLVLIDGIKASDPYQGEFDFATLIADDVARVEVLRGQQSALYGSEAIGGIINYITLSGREAPGLRARIEGGSFGSVDTSARFAGATDSFDYALSGGYQSTDGVPTSRFGSRDVGSENKVFSGRFTFTPTDTFRVKAVLRYSRTKADTNDQDFSAATSPPYGFVVDSDDYYENRAAYGLVRAELDSFDGRWTNAVQAQGVDANRDGFSSHAPFDTTIGPDYGDDGSRERYSYESTLRFGPTSAPQSVTAAFDHERQNYQNTGPDLFGDQGLKRHSTNKGVVVQYSGSVNERIGFGASVRHDDNDLFDSDTTYRLQGSYRFDAGLRLHAAAGTGVTNPGYFELFGFDPGTFTGNPNLRPEKSRGWEAGIEQSFNGDRARIDVTYFNNELQDEIIPLFVFVPSFSSTETNATTDSTQKGVEITLTARPSAQWRVDGAYTYLDARQDGIEEVRRPPHIASLNVGWRTAADKVGVDLTVRYNGGTFDNDFTLLAAPDNRIRLPSFTLVNLGADWQLSDKVQVYGRVENLFDEDYEELFTYRTPGRAEYAGVRITF